MNAPFGSSRAALLRRTLGGGAAARAILGISCCLDMPYLL